MENTIFRKSDEEFPYEVRKSLRARRLGVTVYGNGRVVVTKPRRASLSVVAEFIRRKARWIEAARKRVTRRAGNSIVLEGNYAEDKKRALALVTERVRHFNRIYKEKVGKISIGNQKSRWGSCARNGNLRFNYRLMYLPPELMGSIVVHELAHLTVFNHSKRFWLEVSRADPDYAAHKHAMRKYRLTVG